MYAYLGGKVGDHRVHALGTLRVDNELLLGECADGGGDRQVACADCDERDQAEAILEGEGEGEGEG